MNRKLASLLLSVLMLFSVTACNSGGSSSTPDTSGEQPGASDGGEAAPEMADGYALSAPTTIEFWHPVSNTAHVEVLDQLIDDFNTGVGAELGITVNSTFQGSGAELATNVLAAMKAGNAPHVTTANRYHVADYLNTDYVVDLDPYINDAQVGMQDFDDIFPALSEGGATYAKPGMYSLPIHSFTELLYYNKGFFDEHGLEVPTSWDEVIQVSREITAITGRPAFGWDNLANSLMDLVMQYGGQFSNTEGELLLIEDPVTQQVMQMWQDCVNEGIWRTAGEDMYFSGPFANEVVQMYVGDSVEASYISQKNPDLDWSVAPLPQKDSGNPYAVSGGHVVIALSMDGNEDEKYASYEFIKYLTSTEGNRPVAQVSGYLPIRQSVVDHPDYQAFIAEGGGYAAAQVAGTDQSPAYFFEPVFAIGSKTSTALNSAVKTMMEDVLINGVSPEEALQDLAATIG